MTGKTVLLVAGGDNGGRLQKLLEEHGYETREAENEKRALELWSEQEADYVLMAGREAKRSWIGKLREGQSGYLTDSAGRLRIDLKKHLVVMLIFLVIQIVVFIFGRGLMAICTTIMMQILERVLKRLIRPAMK